MTLSSTSDSEAMSAVHAVAFDAPWSADEIGALLRGPGAYALAVEVGQKMAGFVLCRAVAEEAEILTLAVSPQHRQRGMATELVRAAVEAAKTLGASTVFLEVATDNWPALRLYDASGFRPAGRRASYYVRDGKPIDALVLRRDLNRPGAEPYD
jgi:[ribosomal protein S18]-alanine N-acetyltransferase